MLQGFVPVHEEPTSLEGDPPVRFRWFAAFCLRAFRLSFFSCFRFCASVPWGASKKAKLKVYSNVGEKKVGPARTVGLVYDKLKNEARSVDGNSCCCCWQLKNVKFGLKRANLARFERQSGT